MDTSSLSLEGVSWLCPMKVRTLRKQTARIHPFKKASLFLLGLAKPWGGRVDRIYLFSTPKPMGPKCNVLGYQWVVKPKNEGFTWVFPWYKSTTQPLWLPDFSRSFLRDNRTGRIAYIHNDWSESSGHRRSTKKFPWWDLEAFLHFPGFLVFGGIPDPGVFSVSLKIPDAFWTFG